MPLPDEDCVRRCLNGSPEAFRLLVERYQTALVGRLQTQFGNAEDAAEAAQETLVRAYFALDKLHDPGAFRSWLFGIGDRVAKESFRAAGRPRTMTRERTTMIETAIAEPARDDDAGLSQAIDQLPDMYRQVIVSRFFRRQSCEEISRQLQIPIGTVTKRLSRAYGLLRELLRNRSCECEARQSEVSP